MKVLTTVILFTLMCVSVHAQNALPADEILATAVAQAKQEGKNVLVKFSASWCGWCHKMDAAIKDPVCKKYFDDNFVIVQLIVDEADEKRQLENPGANAIRTKYNGSKEAGIPFWFILDNTGQLIADCYIRNEGQALSERGSNMGCPASEKEVAAFISVLKKTTKLTDQELLVVKERFRKNEMQKD